MHISEGVLSPAVLAGGVALTVVGTAIGLKKMDYEAIPRVAILSAASYLLIHAQAGGFPPGAQRPHGAFWLMSPFSSPFFCSPCSSSSEG
jgi:hypothetical protein